MGVRQLVHISFASTQTLQGMSYNLWYLYQAEIKQLVALTIFSEGSRISAGMKFINKTNNSQEFNFLCYYKNVVKPTTIWFSLPPGIGGLGSVRFTVGPVGPKGLCQPKWFYDSIP